MTGAGGEERCEESLNLVEEDYTSCMLTLYLAPTHSLSLFRQYMLREFGQDQGEEKMRSAIGRFGITGPQQVRCLESVGGSDGAAVRGMDC